VITRTTLALGSFHVRERGFPGRLLRLTSLWVSEFQLEPTYQAVRDVYPQDFRYLVEYGALPEENLSLG
jgi:hypothetical protein